MASGVVWLYGKPCPDGELGLAVELIRRDMLPRGIPLIP